MKPEILALTKYLDIEPEGITDCEDHRYETGEYDYYVFEAGDLVAYINEILYPEQCDLVEEELKSYTRYSEYYRFFTIDYDAIHEYCIENLEEVLGTAEREVIDLGEESYIILEIQ